MIIIIITINKNIYAYTSDDYLLHYVAVKMARITIPVYTIEKYTVM